MLVDFTKKKFDIIIDAGQSNSFGRGFGETKKPYVVNNRVFELNKDFIISTAKETSLNGTQRMYFSLSFADEYLKSGLLKEGRDILIIRCSVGGTGFSNNRWGLKDDLFLDMLEMIKDSLKLNSENKIVAFLWHQGESDSDANCTKQEHTKNLTNMLTTVREKFSIENVPFICGDFVHHFKNSDPKSEAIIQAIKQVVQNNPNCYFVETNGLTSNAQQNFDSNLYTAFATLEKSRNDNLHFSRDALYKLGKRYFKGYCTLINHT